MIRKLKERKGVALLFVFFAITVLSILSSASLGRIASESGLALRQGRSTESFWLAEAGVQKGIYAVMNNDWADWDTLTESSKSITETLGNGNFSVTVSGIGTNDILITSAGNVSGVQRSVEGALQRSSYPMFGYAAFGVNSIKMSGNGFTDSYDSSQGAYGGSNINSNGDVATDGETIGAVALSGNAKVKGDAFTGEGGTVTTSGNAKVTGSSTGKIDIDMPDTEIPSDLSSLGSSSNISVSGNGSQTLTGGNYKTGSISVSGNGTLYVSGTVRIYLTAETSLSTSGNGKIVVNSGGQLIMYTDGTVSISGNGIVNNAVRPQNCLLYSAYDGPGNGVTVSGNGDLKAAIYAPETDIKFSGNGNLYGSAVGKTVEVTGNGNIHYDESLATLDTVEDDYELTNWYELSNPYAFQ